MSNETYIVKVGDRVQIHPATDQWIRGNRCGIVEAVSSVHNALAVRFDATGQVKRVSGRNVYSVNNVVVA